MSIAIIRIMFKVILGLSIRVLKAQVSLLDKFLRIRRDLYIMYDVYHCIGCLSFG